MFRALFDSYLHDFDAKNTYFDVFLTFLTYSGRQPPRCGGGGGTHKLKKIEIARNGLKYTKTILECHIEVPQGHHMGLRHHTGQRIPLFSQRCRPLKKIDKNRQKFF